MLSPKTGTLTSAVYRFGLIVGLLLRHETLAVEKGFELFFKSQRTTYHNIPVNFTNPLPRWLKGTYGGGGIEEQPNENLTSQWFEALREDDLEKVKQLLKTGKIDINCKDQLGWAALHITSWKGLVGICKELLGKAQLDVNLTGPGGSNAVTLAAQRGHTEIVVLLVKHNCDIFKTVSLGGNHDVTALHLAAQSNYADIVRHLVAAGATVNAAMTSRGINGITPLHLAVEAGHMDVMDILIEAGCNIHSSTQAAETSETAC